MNAKAGRVRVSPKFLKYLKSYRACVLAELLDVPQQYVYGWRIGRNQPSVPCAIKILEHAARDGADLSLKDLAGKAVKK